MKFIYYSANYDIKPQMLEKNENDLTVQEIKSSLDFKIIRITNSWDHPSGIIFHYTNAESANSIVMEKKIKENSSINGIGVFLTSLSPNSSDIIISENNFGSNHYMRKLYKCECAFGFFKKDLRNLEIIKDDRYGFKRDITCHDGDIDLTRKSFYLIVRPRCDDFQYTKYIENLK